MRTTMRYVAFICLLMLSSVFGECPNAADLRTEYVKNYFNATLLDGFWYEVAFQDIAQIGESCQCYNKSLDDSMGGSISEQFGFTYKTARSMTLLYTSTDLTAVYTKATTFAPEFAIPYVVVDVSVEKDGQYSTITEYSCTTVGPITYQEIRIGSRSRNISDESMAAIETTLTDLGLRYHLTYVDHPPSCSYNV